MTEHPLVSVIVNNYNYEKFIGAAVLSALDQTYQPTEVIVVDDGSTDGSMDVIEAFADRARVIRQQNQGQAGAFNTGFAAARGEAILFLDSDDALAPDAIETAMTGWRPGVSKIQFVLASIDGDGGFLGNLFPSYPADLSPGDIRKELLRTGLYPCPPTSGNIYARAFLDRIMPLPLGVFGGADGPINTVVPLYGDVITLDQVLGYYRIHGANIWAQMSMNPDKFASYIDHDRHRVDYLRRHAEALGGAVADGLLERAPVHMQYRLASRKLLPARHPVPGESAIGAGITGASAALRSHAGMVSRLVLASWFLLVALSPAGLARRLIALRFAPARRPAWLRTALRRLGVLRAPGATAQRFDLPQRLAAEQRGSQGAGDGGDATTDRRAT